MGFIKKIFRSIGPGFITGASDDDPSGIATYAQTGAMFGFAQCWTALFSFPLMTGVQEMCGRIGLVTGSGLAGVLKKHYSRQALWLTVLLLLVANVINIGTDLGAMAVSAQLVFGAQPLLWLVVMLTVTLFLEIFIPYRIYSSYLKYLTLSLFSYVAVAFVIHVDWKDVIVATIIPHIAFTKDYLINIVAILGTTIAPYLFFWQASEEVEEEVAHDKIDQMGSGQPKVTKKDLSKLKLDTATGMFFSNIVMWFVIITAGATLHQSGITSISSADEVATILRPLAGDLAFFLFALGIIGAGLLAVPVLSGSASYALSEAFGWKEGLNRKPSSAIGFYGIIAIATIVGVTINFFGFNPIRALYYTSVINGIVAPILLLMILFIGNNKEIMGKRVNNFSTNIMVVIAACVMGIAAIALVFSFF